MTQRGKEFLVENAMRDYLLGREQSPELHDKVGKLISTLPEEKIKQLTEAYLGDESYRKAHREVMKSGGMWGGYNVDELTIRTLTREVMYGDTDRLSLLRADPKMKNPEMINDIVKSYPEGQAKRDALAPEVSARDQALPKIDLGRDASRISFPKDLGL